MGKEKLSDLWRWEWMSVLRDGMWLSWVMGAGTRSSEESLQLGGGRHHAISLQ